MASDCQRPSKRMMLVSILEQRRAMAPPARRERALTSLGTRPRLEPQAATDQRRASVISAGVTGWNLSWKKYVARGVVGVALACRRWIRRRAVARTGHAREAPLKPCWITSPLTPFFCVVNVRDTCVAVNRSLIGSWKVSMRRRPAKS